MQQVEHDQAMQGGEILQAIFDQPSSLVDYLCHWSQQHKYVYVETPKVACTTIKRVLQQAELGREIVWEDPSFVHDRTRSPLLQPSQDTALFSAAMSGEECFRFCFVRNPFTRILSCWLDKMVQVEVERTRLAPLLGLDPNRVPTFLEFLSAVAEQQDGEHDIHWSPQTYLLRPNRIKYSFIGRFEAFREHFGKVCTHLNFASFAEQLPDTGHATDAGGKLKEHMGSREIELVHRIYERDFRSFGYGWLPAVI